MRKQSSLNNLAEDELFAKVATEMIKALAHPIRLRIVAQLCGGEENVSGLTRFLQEKQSIVSQQLRILRGQGLVAVKRVDGFAVYRIAEPRLRELLSCIEGCSIIRRRADHLAGNS